MIRGLLGADPSTGAIEIGDVVEVGATVQFQVRDAAGADKDLRLTVERAGAELSGRPVGALLFTCNGRGRRMFGVADHDASTIEGLLGGIPLAGFFAAGEIGPVAGRNAGTELPRRWRCSSTTLTEPARQRGGRSAAAKSRLLEGLDRQRERDLVAEHR